MGPVVYLSEPIKYTISIAINLYKGLYSSNYSGIMVVSTLSMIPAGIIYAVGQKYFIEGIVLSGIKT
jgi:multiple sugar transport system permease protein